MDVLHRAAHHTGEQKQIQLPGITPAMVHADDSRNHVPWQCHENPHLTFVVQGEVIERTKKEVYNCSAANLLFHSGFEPRYSTAAYLFASDANRQLYESEEFLYRLVKMYSSGANGS